MSLVEQIHGDQSIHQDSVCLSGANSSLLIRHGSTLLLLTMIRQTHEILPKSFVDATLVISRRFEETYFR